MTSLLDTSYGAGGTFATTNNPSQTPKAGDWAGIYFGPGTSGSLDYVILQYAGGESTIEGGSEDSWNPIEIYQANVRIADSTFQNNAGGGGGDRNGRQSSQAAVIYVIGAQPVIVNNIIQNNGGPAININVNALNNNVVPDWGRETGLSLSSALTANYTQVASNYGPLYTQFFNNYGPLVRLNELANNTINGMVVRGGALTTQSIWDDTDIVHVVESAIEVGNQQTESGLRLQSSSTQSLVVKLLGQYAGFTADGTPLDISDRIGGSMQIIGQPGHPVILTSLNDSTVGAGFDPSGNPDNATNNNPNSTGKPGDWQSVTIGEYSNDTNMAEINEQELAWVNGKDTNNTPQTAQYLGALAPNQASGNDTQRLGYQVNGAISQSSDVDVYSFSGQAGSEVWMQLDRTSAQLNSVIELVDSNGAVIASESTDASGNPIYTGTALPMSQGQLGPAITDPYSTNQHDAAMRVILPGTSGSTNTYYVRIRSDSSNLSNLTGGQSEGLYTLQIRLQQQVQFPGCVVQYASLDYATTGVQVLGQPNLSPLLGETESNTANNSFATAQDLGNLLSSNQATVAVGGSLNSSTQVDWYKLTINYDLIQRIAGASADKTWPTMFDMDYADGLTRADTTMGIYDSSGNLILIGRDSQVTDDQPSPNSGADTQNLGAGSEGSLDPFIGTQQMPVGASRTYYIAVTSAAQLPQQLDQTYTATATNPLIRLEPIDSVNRVVEDHFTVTSGTSSSTAAPPSGTAQAANTIFGTSASAVDSHDVAYTLGNVVLYVTGPNGSSSELYTTNPSTGGKVTDQGTLASSVGDLAMRNDGELYDLSLGTTDANSGNYTQVNTGTAASISSQNDGIQTYQIDINNPTNPTTGQPNYVAYNKGVQFTAMAYQQSGTNRVLYAVGQIPAGAYYGGATGDLTTNLIYELDPNTGQVLNNPGQAALPTNATTTGLLPGVNLLVPDATGPSGSPEVNAGETVTIPGGSSTVTFEFISGPSAVIDYPAGGQDIRDGQKFTVDGKTYEFDEGKVFNITGPGTSFNNHDTFTVTNSGGTTYTFEFLTPGSVITNPGNIGVAFGPAFSATQMASAMATAINTAGIGVTATLAGGTAPTRINLTGDTGISSGSAGITIDGNFGVGAGNIAIPFNEAQTTAQIGASIQSFVTANDSSVQVGFAYDRINFYGANPATTNLTLTAPAVPTGGPGMTQQALVTLTPGDIAVPYLFSDTGSQLAAKLAAAVNSAVTTYPGYAVTATANGADVSLTGTTGTITTTSPITISGTGGGGGLITGMAFIGNTLYAVSSGGGLFIINNPGGSASLTFVANPTLSGGAAISFSGLTAGPPDVSGGIYANDLFATDSAGNLYAFTTSGVMQKIFDNNTAYTVSTGVAGATGLAFSTLDYNLWHVTNYQASARSRHQRGSR